MDFLKTIGGKVISGIVLLVVIVAAISWFTMDVATKDALISGTGRILAWLGVVAIVPWASYALIRYAASFDNNSAGALLVSVLTIGEAVLLAWLFGWSLPTTTSWIFYILGVLIAGVYNTLACDWIADRTS